MIMIKHLVSTITSSFQCGCAHMYGRFSSSFALLISLVVIGISAACGICILFTQTLKYYLTTAFIHLFTDVALALQLKVGQEIIAFDMLLFGTNRTR